MKVVYKTILVSMIAIQYHAYAVEPVSANQTTILPTTSSGIALANIDNSIRPQDNLYSYANGTWIKNTEIPADQSRWGSFNVLAQDILTQLRGIIEQSQQTKTDDATQQKIADFYSSFMDESKLDALGIKPLAGELGKINALKHQQDIAAYIAYLTKIGATAPFAVDVGNDAKNSSVMRLSFSQSGLGLPDRDYYLKNDAKLVEIKTKYQAYVEHLLQMSGDHIAKQHAEDIVKLETSLASVQWSKVENRDPVKTYNIFSLDQLSTLSPHFAWNRYLAETGIKAKVDSVNVTQPSYIKALDPILVQTPIEVWKAYFRFHLIDSFAPYLSKDYVDASFAFKGTALRGTPQNKPRWKRGVDVINQTMGEGLGKLYVAQYFPAENKARMASLVNNLLTAYRQSIDTLDWMSPETKQQAQKKLAAINVKIGYPNKWRDYSALDVKKDDLVGNEIRAAQFEYQYELNKLGKPADRDEWDMSPQTVNAYYNPSMNEIVFPAAILQPPFFDVHADDAVNYGAIGAVIGHEISHGFDDQGSQYDAAGNLNNWWTEQDHEKFKLKTNALIEQYNAYSPVKGYNVNGALTLGENIADNSGLAIAYKAYHLALGDKTAPTLDGLTGDQRFYVSWAQAWHGKIRDEMAIEFVKSDPHSPTQFRANGTVVNQPGFYKAFGVKEGDKMYLAPEKRVSIW